MAGVDAGLGHLLDILTAAGTLHNTVIAFSSDNGGVPYAGALNYPWRGGKATVWEGGVRSPGFLHWPAGGLKPRRHPGLVHVSDWLPTLLALAGGEGGPALDGVDQSAALRGGPPARTAVHIHRDTVVDSHVYRRGDWKIIVGHHYIPFLFSQGGLSVMSLPETCFQFTTRLKIGRWTGAAGGAAWWSRCLTCWT